MQTQKIENAKLEMVDKFVRDTNMNIFLTGKAGTGKTTFLRNLAKDTYKRLVILAPTGVAAINAGGQTIHSFFQLDFGPQIPDDGRDAARHIQPLQYQKFSAMKLKIIRSLDLLVIDEISMVRADLLDAVDAVLRRVRRNDKPFGGLQVLMIGDIHQLAPVAKAEEESSTTIGEIADNYLGKAGTRQVIRSYKGSVLLHRTRSYLSAGRQGFHRHIE